MTIDKLRGGLAAWAPFFQAITMLSATGVLAVSISLTYWIAKRESRLEAVEERSSENTGDIRELNRTVAALAQLSANNTTLLSERTKQIEVLTENVDRIRDRIYAAPNRRTGE